MRLGQAAWAVPERSRHWRAAHVAHASLQAAYGVLGSVGPLSRLDTQCMLTHALVRSHVLIRTQRFILRTWQDVEYTYGTGKVFGLERIQSSWRTPSARFGAHRQFELLHVLMHALSLSWCTPSAQTGARPQAQCLWHLARMWHCWGCLTTLPSASSQPPAVPAQRNSRAHDQVCQDVGLVLAAATDMSRLCLTQAFVFVGVANQSLCVFTTFGNQGTGAYVIKECRHGTLAVGLAGLPDVNLHSGSAQRRKENLLRRCG